MIFRNVTRDLIESKHSRFLDKNETMRVDKDHFSSVNVLSINMMTLIPGQFVV